MAEDWLRRHLILMPAGRLRVLADQCSPDSISPEPVEVPVLDYIDSVGWDDPNRFGARIKPRWWWGPRWRREAGR